MTSVCQQSEGWEEEKEKKGMKDKKKMRTFGHEKRGGELGSPRTLGRKMEDHSRRRVFHPNRQKERAKEKLI